jgi:TPR repeat protein
MSRIILHLLQVVVICLSVLTIGCSETEEDRVARKHARQVEYLKGFLIDAQKGDPEAQTNVGDYYQSSWGLPERDLVQAVKWYRLAASQGFPAAQHALGLCYEYGKGVPVDYIEAASWYRKAAYQGYARAQRKLFYFYSRGMGVEKDEKTGDAWLQLADEQDHLNNMQNKKADTPEGPYLGWHPTYMRLNRIIAPGAPKDISNAISWWRDAALSGDARAQYNMAVRYHLGRGVVEDEVEAYAYLNLAAIEDSAAVEMWISNFQDASLKLATAGQKRTRELQREIEARRAAR